MSNYCINCEATATRAEKAEAEVERLCDIISPGEAAAYEEGMAALKDEVERLQAALEEWKRTDNAPGCTACSVLAAALRGGEEREECGYCGSQLCTGSCQT